MIVVPLVTALLITAVAASRARRQGRDPRMAPSTRLGRVALASLALMLVVVLADAALVVSAPVGAAMLTLSGWAWWRCRDHGLLLAFPVVFGFWTLLIPALFE